MTDFAFKGFDGPRDLHAVFTFRPGTADENTILATYHEDEYHFVDFGPQDGDWMIDAGGYIGSTAILYAQLYPKAHVLTIEPLPENVLLLRKNIEANGLSARITVLDRALWSTSVGSTKVFYRDASTVGSVHRFIGSAFPNYHETVSKDGAEALNISLDHCIELYGMNRVRLLKMDVEGAEYPILEGVSPQMLGKIQTMTGEYHNTDPQNEKQPRTKLYTNIEPLFDDCSKEPEKPTWGAFLFQRK